MCVAFMESILMLDFLVQSGVGRGGRAAELAADIFPSYTIIKHYPIIHVEQQCALLGFRCKAPGSTTHIVPLNH
jgi:hypothetical protein